MKKILFIIILFSSFNFAQVEKFGREISLTEKTKISEILANPESFVGKTVLVEGEVLEVCQHAGCWMELKSDGDGKIRIKVKDGDIVFPVSAVGGKAVAEGTVYKIELSQEEAVKYYEHLAEESGKEFNPESVTGPVTIYQIKGIGAEIDMPKELKVTE
jgi:RecJ-like exonuclease